MTDQQAPVDIHDLLSAGTIQAPPQELTQDDKVEWGKRNVTLEVYASEMLADEEGKPYFRFFARHADGRIMFNLGCNGKRDAWLSDVSDAVQQAPVTGLRLKTYEGGRGKPRVELEPV